MTVQTSRLPGAAIRLAAATPPGCGAAPGLADGRPPVPVHGDQLRRQGGRRHRRGADHGRAASRPARVRPTRLELSCCLPSPRSSPASSSTGSRRAGRSWSGGSSALTQFRCSGTQASTIVAARIALGAGEGQPIRGLALGLQMVSQRAATCPPPSWRKAPASASWWRCRCSAGSSSVIPGIGHSACWASPVSSSRRRGSRSAARPLTATACRRPGGD